jgi:quinol monooxygenase YgiN
MRKWLFSLSALVLVALPVHAQTPAPAPQHGLKSGSIALVVTGEVLPGQMDNFRKLVTRLVAAVAEEEPGTLVYEFSLQPDQKTYNVMEVYQNYDALAARGQTYECRVLAGISASKKDHECNCLWIAGCTGQRAFGPSQSCIHISY